MSLMDRPLLAAYCRAQRMHTDTLSQGYVARNEWKGSKQERPGNILWLLVERILFGNERQSAIMAVNDISPPANALRLDMVESECKKQRHQNRDGSIQPSHTTKASPGHPGPPPCLFPCLPTYLPALSKQHGYRAHPCDIMS